MPEKMKLPSRAILTALGAFGSLPAEFRGKLGALLGIIFSLIPTRDRAICQAQIRAVLRAGASETSQLTRKVYAHLGRTLAESVNLAPFLAASEQFSFPEEQRARALTNSGQPLICLTGHVGSWDLFGALMTSRGFPLTAIGREARNQHLQEVLANLRGRYGIETIWRTNSAQGARDILRALKSRRWVAALIDQDTRVAGTHVPFFGIPAVTPSSLIELALRQKAHVVSAFLVREGRGGRVMYRELPSSGSAAEVLAAYHAHLEEVIRAYPEQWVWIHKRWRTLPSGERLSSAAYLLALNEGSLGPDIKRKDNH
jgi:KDO2-lipid IV(A) lauroyltransferase